MIDFAYSLPYNTLWPPSTPRPALVELPGFQSVQEVIVVNSSSITGIPLFKDVPASVLEKIASISQAHDFQKGQLIFREGEKAAELHFLIKGSIALRVNIMTRPDFVTVSFVEKPFECFGWSGLITPHYYTSSASCEEDCKTLTIPGDQLFNILENNPEAGFKVMYRVANLISDRLRNSRQALLKTL